MIGNIAIPRKIAELSLERKVYCFTLTACALLSSWTLYHDSTEFDEVNTKRNRQLGLGWRFLGIKQDIANFEWTFWFSDLRENIILCLIGHIATSWLFANYFPRAKDTATAVFCAYCAHAAVGGSFIIIVLAFCISFYAIISVLNSLRICWIITITSILLLHFDGFYMEILPSVLQVDGNFLAIAYSAIAFTILRSSSFCMEKLNDVSSSNEYSIATLLQYNFYLPYFFFGPVMTFDTFKAKNATAPTGQHITNILTESLKIAVTIMIVDLILHFIHISSIAVDLDYLQRAPSYIIGFVFFCNVLLDWLKASVLYGVTRSIAEVVDGHQMAPKGPLCTATICTFADTFFDRGIQHWASRYCYDRIGGNHTNLTKESFASVMTFVVVAIWQGLSFQVIVWAIVNCLGLTFEFFISQLTPAEDKEYKRVMSFFLGLNYWCILFFNVVGINGVDTAYVGFKSLLFGGNILNFGIAVYLSYCYAALVCTEPRKLVKNE